MCQVGEKKKNKRKHQTHKTLNCDGNQSTCVCLCVLQVRVTVASAFALAKNGGCQESTASATTESVTNMMASSAQVMTHSVPKL